MSTISVKVVFGGGLEQLFSNEKTHGISLPSQIPVTWDPSQVIKISGTQSEEKRPVNITYLIHWLKEHLLKERSELFEEGGTVRPGILVLVNDTDWELEGEGDYELKDNDEIVFISTLHGG
ncbi:ubiquitin-like modifier 1 [Punctularia strigosozonata HHB-11173 SS5]|uniref:ubiquitin-like modifier 1 n=1 Tax=Punctularia strigosozonata (strain HHB-11173) TaxID=741275 RepID=UPI000441829A|nr:ubiquitin-like modifier 1 [Punctularia strigosozonata HHB-11173 SS5]EIN14473.1 ubiquitin-like modifier 1 [Punctularia strigosozonata HHB-11173 SS5]